MDAAVGRIPLTPGLYPRCPFLATHCRTSPDTALLARGCGVESSAKITGPTSGDRDAMPDLHRQLDIGSDEAPVSKPLSETEAVRMLESAGITAATLVPWGSNYTFAVGLTDPEGR